MIAPGVLSTGGTLPSGTGIPEALVQVYDRSYNVAYSDRKVEGHTFSPLPAPGQGDPKIVLSPQPPASGYYSAPPSISLDPGAHSSATFEYSIDGSAFQKANGPVSAPNPSEGEHLVSYRGSDGSTASTRFAVDTQAPTIVAEADRAANANGWYGGPVTFTFTCGDAVSGVASCPAPVTLSASGEGQSFSVSATDKAGNSGQITVRDINIDSTVPAISATPASSPNQYGWYSAPVDVNFGCADSLSGLASCGNKALSGAPKSATDKVTLSGEGRDQTATGTATDLAGNSATATSPKISIDKTAPQAAITTANGAILIGTQKLTGTASDALSGVRTVTVTYTSGSNTVTKDGALTCNSSGSCTWTADTPGLGIWRASAMSTDYAGNNSAATGPVLITIR